MLLDLLMDLAIIVLHMMEVRAELQHLVSVHAAPCLLGVILVNCARVLALKTKPSIVENRNQVVS